MSKKFKIDCLIGTGKITHRNKLVKIITQNLIKQLAFIQPKQKTIFFKHQVI